MSGGDWKEMFLACQQGDIELVKYHIRTGIDANYKHPEFLTTALIESVSLNKLAIVTYLLENGADPLVRDDFTGETSISIAEQRKDKTLLKLLQSYIHE